MFKNALVSVSDKTGLDEFLRPLAERGMRIVSSGGTARYLEERGFNVVSVSDQTQFPEVMGGRVKTLHPNIHMPILQRADVKEDQNTLSTHGLEPFDLVVVNLYPFVEGLKKQLSEKEMIELIDIGGPTLLRASAKNFNSVAVVCDPEDYTWIAGQKEISFEERKKLAGKVFKHVSTYDQHITDFFHGATETSLKGEMHKELRYGENPSQQAWWFKNDMAGIHDAEILQGKELSYNNLLDLDAAVNSLRLFADSPAVVSVKHNNPCGVARSGSLSEALSLSLKADPVSVFGGIIALNGEIDLGCANQLIDLFLECIVAPSITEEARQKLAEKKNLRVLTWDSMMQEPSVAPLFRSIDGGYLKQTSDQVGMDHSQWKLVNGQLSDEDWLGLSFAWKVCSCLKSNAIAVTSANQTLGLGMGQVNRVDAVDQAFSRAEQFHPQNKDRYLASDAFFPFPDSIELAAQRGAKAIIQPGGSVKDDAVIAKAKELNLPMVFTGRRHFRH